MMTKTKHLLSATIMGGILLFAASASHASDPAADAVVLAKLIADKSVSKQSLTLPDITLKMDARRQLMDRLQDRTKNDPIPLMENAKRAGVDNLDIFQNGIDLIFSQESETNALNANTVKFLERASESGDWHRQYLANLFLGSHFIHERENLKAMTYAQNALESIPTRDVSMTANDARYETYDLLHTAFTVDRNTVKMIEATEKLLDYADRTGRQVDRVPLIHNLGYLFSKSQDFDTASQISELLIGIQDDQPDYQRAIANYSHGANLVEAGSYDAAIPYLEKAGHLAGETRFGVAARIRLALAFSKTGQSSRSQRLIHQLETSTKERDTFERMIYVVTLAKAENAFRLGNYREAYTYLDSSSTARAEELESMLSEDRRRASEGLALSERVAKEKADRLQSEVTLSNKIAQRGKIISLFVGLLALALGFIAFNLNRHRKRQIQINAELAESRDHAKAGEQAKSNFLSMMGHELRTPMNPIISLSDILYARSNDPDTKSMLRMISASGRSMLSMVENILIVSDNTRRKMAVSLQRTKISTFAQFVTTGFKRDAEDKGLEFSVSIDKNVPEYLDIDKLKLKSILSNILSNAIKFTDSGSVDMSLLMVRDEHIGVSLLMSIQDTGHGMAVDEIAALKSIFQQRENTHTKSYDGVGVGLHVTELYVKAHGGRMDVNSHPQHGTRVDIYLPYRASARLAEAA